MIRSSLIYVGGDSEHLQLATHPAFHSSKIAILLLIDAYCDSQHM
jgi:hypothetical protein